MAEAPRVYPIRLYGDPVLRRKMQRSRVINAVGLGFTAVVLVVVLVTKFLAGAWITVLAMAFFFVVMRAIKQHYDKVAAELAAHYGTDCPVAVVWRASWPDQRIVRGTLATIAADVGETMERTALILVGRALAAEDFDESRLYAADYDRRFRAGRADAVTR